MRVVARIVFLVCFTFFLYADDGATIERQSDDRTQIKKGNFALLSSQQPGPLISFGQNMLDKKDLQTFLIIDDLDGCEQKLVSVVPTILYGFRDDLSLYVQIPVAAKWVVDSMTITGIQDLLVQLEWAYHDNIQWNRTKQSSIVVNMTFPLGDFYSFDGSLRDGPKLYGIFGVPTAFVGLTADYFTPEWYFFISGGARLIPTNNTYKNGNQFLYQWGISHNFSYKADDHIFNITVEFDGTYRQKDLVHGIPDPNTGGNEILLGPSIWYSTPHFSFQIGLSGVIYQYLNGKQDRDRYLFSVELGYKFT